MAYGLTALHALKELNNTPMDQVQVADNGQMVSRNSYIQ